MTDRKLTRIQLLLLVAPCLALGCAQSDRPSTFPVRGKVVYRGKPVADAWVSFLAPGAPRPAVGTTDENGNFQLTTFEPNDGAILGTHVVTVRKYARVAEPPREPPPADGGIDNAAIEREMQESARRADEAEKAGSELPLKYASHKTSDLRQQVVDGDNDVTIELVD
jgi:hypothetical protein